jgi:hypothetical protein
MLPAIGAVIGFNLKHRKSKANEEIIQNHN